MTHPLWQCKEPIGTPYKELYMYRAHSQLARLYNVLNPLALHIRSCTQSKQFYNAQNYWHFHVHIWSEPTALSLEALQYQLIQIVGHFKIFELR